MLFNMSYFVLISTLFYIIRNKIFVLQFNHKNTIFFEKHFFFTRKFNILKSLKICRWVLQQWENRSPPKFTKTPRQ